MPPLLPEYLSQPVQVIIQAPTVDWMTVICAGLFTLGGAALGAWLGAKGAYAASVKASNHQAHLNRIKRILPIIDRLSQKFRSFSAHVDYYFYNERDKLQPYIAENTPLVDSEFKELIRTIKHELKSEFDKIDQLHDIFVEAEVSCFILSNRLYDESDKKAKVDLLRKQTVFATEVFKHLDEKISYEIMNKGSVD
ncbi:hypothetical protein [Vreelandella venusta]|uniref:hypothetical protein n=1 Tax=Vreelandella venusta TaxID=44935 RepID=UPI0018DA66B5|nr:hypothetical protein [Halomonas venusta]QPI65922.1 hypothetical protein IR195_09595 [Halomonas venusta]